MVNETAQAIVTTTVMTMEHDSVAAMVVGMAPRNLLLLAIQKDLDLAMILETCWGYPMTCCLARYQSKHITMCWFQYRRQNCLHQLQCKRQVNIVGKLIGQEVLDRSQEDIACMS